MKLHLELRALGPIYPTWLGMSGAALRTATAMTGAWSKADGGRLNSAPDLKLYGFLVARVS